MNRPPFWRVPRNRKAEEEDFVAHVPRVGHDNKLSHEEAIIMKKSGDALLAFHKDGQSTPTSSQQKSTSQTATLQRKAAEMNAENDAHRDQEVAIGHQPYRTTPLILPGAKVRRESMPTQSYLQMQSGSKLWNSGSSSNQSHPSVIGGMHHEAVASGVFVKPKEKVFDPMKGWRMDAQQAADATTNEADEQSKADQKENIEQSTLEDLHAKFYNPRESETFRALMETETKAPKNTAEVKKVQQKIHTAPNAPFKHVNLMGLPQEKIQQSYSFRRLMNDVLGETDF